MPKDISKNTNHLSKREGRRNVKRRNYYKQVFQPTIFKKNHRNYLRLPGYQRNKSSSFAKKLKPRKVKALFLAGIIFSAMISGILITLMVNTIDVTFTSKKRRADVNEQILFSWDVAGSFSQGAIMFGDGSSVELNDTSNSVSHSYSVQGKYTPLVHVWNQNGFSVSKALSIEIKNYAPEFEVSMPNSAHEDQSVEIRIENIVESEVDLANGVLNYLYDFADNNQTTSSRSSIFHKWENAGEYPITITLFDDQGALSQKTEYIEIFNTPPVADFALNITEDFVEFNAEPCIDTESDYNSLTYIWDFGDNQTSFGKHSRHVYELPGLYIVELCVKDDNGAVDFASRSINIENIQSYESSENNKENEVELEILGPYTLPQNIEGQMVNLDVETYDSLENEPSVEYSWYDENNNLVSNDKRPSLMLSEGEHRFTFNLTNGNGQTASENINVKVNNIAPEVFVSNYAYNGPNRGKKLGLDAYGYDSLYDVNKLKFYWKITDGYTNYTFSDTVGRRTSSMPFTCSDTAIYRGQVKVVDPSGKECVESFIVNVVIDNNKNGVPDTIESLLELTDESLDSFSDYDNDLISDECEHLILHTNFVNPDSDGDGLSDGLDANGIGELSLGTNPLNPDTDFDLLIDSVEFYGWNITINSFEGSKEIHVSSEPLSSDSDNDGVSDYDEFQNGSNPKAKDSDGDGLIDLYDPYPTSYDHDNDYLSDKIELDIGTDLNNSDSDLDGITDGEEYYGSGILGFKTDPLDPDDDDDFASDNSEMKFYSIQLENHNKNEIRVNVSNPVSLHFPYFFQIATTAQISVALSFGEHGTNQTGEYGIKDEDMNNLTITLRHEGYNLVLFETTTNKTRHFSHVIDVSKVMNNASLSYNYHGNYILEVSDPTAGCLVERFELEFCRPLDPLNEDFDGDGILDGVEMNLLVNGTDKIDVKDTCTKSQLIVNSTEYNSNQTTTYQLEIPQIGRIFSAELYLSFESIGDIHTGTIIEFELAKNYLDNRLEKDILVLVRQQNSYDNYEMYSTTFDLFELLQDNEIVDFYGEYALNIRLESLENVQDQIIINEFYIQTETYVDAGPLDSHAWLTDPALFDTDEDGWSDSYEIFTANTNPLNDDTDGDGALDANDRDPLKNIVLEISPISASYRNQMWPTTNPTLKIGMYLQVNDLSDPNGLDDNNIVGFFTSKKETTTDIYGWDYFTYQTAWWNGGEGTHYYFDVNDDFTAQSNEVKFYFTLWESALLKDINRFDGNWYTDTFDLGSVEPTQTLNVQQVGAWGRIDEITVTVTKINVEKTNTIAIYSENESAFNGHYQHQERMNMFQLHITDSGIGTPFVQGANAIVVPTSLFTKTKLNAFIENGQLDQTVLYSGVEGEFEFYSVDRDGEIVGDECGDADFVFVRYEMTSQEAMELLDLLLTCAVNQSLDENNQTVTDLSTIYSCVSTKLNGTDAVQLNVPNSMSKFILWGGGYQDSPYGSAPSEYNPVFLWLFLIPLLLPTIGLIVIFSLTITSITQLNNNNAGGIGLMLLTFLANLLWCLIRAALIVIAYILLAIEVLTISIIFLGIGIVLDITSIFSGFECEWGINWAIPYGVDTKIAFVELEMNGYDVTVEAYITWTYWEYFDIYFPLLTMDSKLGSLLGDVIDMGNNASTPPELGCGYDHIGGLTYDFHATYRQRPQGYAPNYVTLVLVSPSGTVYNYSMNETPGQSFDSYYNWVRFNKTIDFGEMFDYNERQGQWHYCFLTQASVINATMRWPSDGYAIGPRFHENRSYFLSSYLEPFSGYVDTMFNFTVTGYDFLDGLDPHQVYLKIKWPNETIETFSMNIASTFVYDEMNFNTYCKALNFSNHISIDKPTTLSYYYEAVFADGSVDVLWDYQTVEEEVDVDDDYNDGDYEYEYIPCWFEGPLLKPKINGTNKPPIIWNWYVEDLTWDRVMSDTSDLRVLSPISDEFILRFWIYAEDPDGTHEQHWNNGYEFVPKLILTNLDTPNNSLEPIEMKWTGGHYGPGPDGYDEYFIDVFGDGHYAHQYEQTSDLTKCNFTSGAWKFRFEVSDNQSHVTTETPPNRMWHIGSFENMQNTFFYGHPTGVGVLGFIGSIAVSIGYMAMAFLASSSKMEFQIAAQILAATLAVVDIVSDLVAISAFVFTTNDMGSLIGLGLHMFVKSVGFLIALSLSNRNGGAFNFNFLNTFSGLLMALMIFDANDDVMGINWEENEDGTLVPSEENDPPTLNELLGGLPMMVVAFFSSIVGLTTSLVITSGAGRSSVGPEHIKTIMVVHTIISVVLSSLCIFTFLFRTGFFHIINGGQN